MVIVNKRQVLIERGDIFEIEFGNDQSGEVIKQPVLVIQNDIGNRFCDTVIVVPLFPDLRLEGTLLGVLIKASSETGLTTDHVALFTQICTVAKKSFREETYLGRPEPDVMARVDEAIKLSLGLSTLQRLQTRRRSFDRLEKKRNLGS